MNTNKYKNALLEFGLKESEADVYLTALRLGPSPILPISRETGIRRTTVYEIIKSLTSKGLITIETKGFKKLFCASNPKSLVTIFEEKKNKLETVVPELVSFYKTRGLESNIKSYEGLPSIKSLYLEILDAYKPGDFCYILGDTDKFLNMDPVFFSKYIEDRAKLNLDTKIILTNSQGAEERKKYQRNFNSNIKILYGKTTLAGNFTITNSIYVIQSLDTQLFAITTNNKDLISLQKNLFEAIWDSLEKQL